MSRAWFAVAMLAGVLYAAVGIGFARLAGAATSHSGVVFWRLAAWAAGGIVFAVHIAYEHIHVRHAPAALALDTAIAAGLGGLGLAIGASIHSRHPVVPAMLIWPFVTAIPAFLAAFVIGTILSRLSPRKPAP